LVFAHGVGVLSGSTGVSVQFIPRPTSTTLLDQMPLFYQRLEVLLKRIAITAGQAPLNSSMLEIRLRISGVIGRESARIM